MSIALPRTLDVPRQQLFWLLHLGGWIAYFGQGCLSAIAHGKPSGYWVVPATAALTGALTSLKSLASTLGSNLSVAQTRQDFTKELANVLTTGAGNLVLADPNEEGASLLALNTRQQLSQTALSLANQADQGVLRLFG